MKETHGILNGPLSPWRKKDSRAPFAFGQLVSLTQGHIMTFMGSFSHKKVQIIFSECVGIKMNRIQAGFIGMYTLLLYSFFLLILKETDIKRWVPRSIMSPKHCVYCTWWKRQPWADLVPCAFIHSFIHSFI